MYKGYANKIPDQGAVFTSDGWKQLIKMDVNTILMSVVPAHCSLGSFERLHDSLRLIY